MFEIQNCQVKRIVVGIVQISSEIRTTSLTRVPIVHDFTFASYLKPVLSLLSRT